MDPWRENSFIYQGSWAERKRWRRGKSQDVERRRTSKHEGMFWMILSKVAHLLRKVERTAFQ